VRTLLATLSAVLLASLVLAGVLLAGTGRSFVYHPGMGSVNRYGWLVPWGSAIAIAAAAIGVLCHFAARARPRQYYQLMWRRDAAWLVGVTAALVVTIRYVGRVLMHGA